MVGAVEDVQDGGAILEAFCAKEGMDFCHVFMGVESLGQPALVGDQHHFEARRLGLFQGVHDGGQNGEFGQVLGVVSRVVVDDTVAVEEEAGRRLMLQT